MSYDTLEEKGNCKNERQNNHMRLTDPHNIHSETVRLMAYTLLLLAVKSLIVHSLKLL